MAARAAGVDTEVATIDEGPGGSVATARLREARIPVHVFPLSEAPYASRFHVSRSMSRWLRKNSARFDVVHVHGAWTGSSLAGLLMGKVRHVPVVLTPHESMTEHDVLTSGLLGRLVKRTLRRIYLRAADAFVFASELELRDSVVAQSARCVVIPHPVELVPPPNPGRPAGRQGRLRVGFLGRLDPKKNLDVLLRALPEHAELNIAGDGPDAVRTSMEALAVTVGVEDRVRWLGFVEGETKTRFFADLDLLVMPSRYENWGMVAAEALAAGVPVVVSPATGIAAMVNRRGCGYVVEPDVGSLRSLLANPTGLAEKASRARAAADAELSLERHGEALAALYQDLTFSESR